jgi:2-succinyl-6-hydroxy-2,4-cyclohexadiene-1-carboxylate synthase
MLNYTITGNRSSLAVLFLHGFLGAASDWQRCTAQLQDEFRCIGVDLPGHGRSLRCDDDAYSFDGCVEAIVDVLDRTGVQQCSVVGYSMGGRIALYLTHRFPEQFKKVVLESASPGLQTEAERQARRAQDERLAQELESQPIEAFLHRWYAQPLFQTLAADQARWQRIIEQRQHNDPHELAKVLRGLSTGAQPSLWARLPEIEAHMLIIVGEHDAKFGAIGQRMAQLQSAARLVIVPNAGHNVHEEQSDAFVELIRAFLAEGVKQDLL